MRFNAKGSSRGGRPTQPPAVEEEQLRLGIVDNGDNSFTLNYDFNAATFFDSSYTILLGSSTANGAGATAGNALKDLLACTELISALLLLC